MMKTLGEGENLNTIAALLLFFCEKRSKGRVRLLHEFVCELLSNPQIYYFIFSRSFLVSIGLLHRQPLRLDIQNKMD